MNYAVFRSNLLPSLYLQNVVEETIGTLSNHDGNTNENVAWKYKFALLVLLRNYSNSFNLYNVAEQFRNRSGRSGVLHKTLNLVISCCCFAEDGKEMYQNL